MDSLIEFNDKEMNEKAIYMCALLFNSIPKQEIQNLVTNPAYIEILLDIIENRAQLSSDIAELINSTLFILLKLTDHSIKSREIFVEKRGMDLYLTILNVRSLLIHHSMNEFFFTYFLSMIFLIFLIYLRDSQIKGILK
jgi:hypothetical protein